MDRGASVQTKYLLSTVTASPSDAGLPSCVISTINPDRDHDRVIPEGMDATSFMKAPTLFWAHGASERYAAVPIGSVTSLDVTPGQGIKATWRWLENDAFADRIKNAWDQGVIRGTSIGFRPIKMTPNGMGGMDHEQFELLELSIAPVPANAECVRALKAVGLTDEEIEPLVLTVEPEPEAKAIETVQKRGRVLSAVNESKLRAALEALNGVLAQLMPMTPDDMPEDDMPVEDAVKPPMPEDDMDPEKPHKPKPMMALDDAETYSLTLAEEDLADDFRLTLADDPAPEVLTFSFEPDVPTVQMFTVDPAVIQAVIIEAMREQLVGPIGDSVQRALDRARGRVQ
jgi:HK97 family phage prohead protease